MKNSFFVMLALCVSLGLSSQDSPGVTKTLLGTKQIIKTNLVSYAILSVNANYEYKTSPSTSVGLFGGYKLPTTIELSALGELDGESMSYRGEIEPEGFYVNPYFRYYTGGALTGFYIEAFTRYYDYKYLVPYNYDKDGSNIEANLDGTANGIGGGLSLGGQFQLAPKFYMDIYLGFGVGSGSMHVETNDPNLDAQDYLDIKQNIEENRDDAEIDIFLLGTVLENITAGADENSAWADIENQLFPMTRGGIAIGFGF